MRLTTSSLLAPLLLASSTLARQAYVYIVDSRLPTTASHHLQSLPASDARLIFAHRLGLSEFHSLENEGLNIPAIEALNVWGGRSQSLFGSQSTNPSGSIVFVEGYDNANDFLPLDLTTTSFRFTIPDAPSAEDNHRFVEDLQKQSSFLSQQSSTSSTVKILKKGHSGSDADIKHQLQRLVEGDLNAIVVFTEPFSSSSFSRQSKGWGSYRAMQRRQLDLGSGRPDIRPGTSFEPMEVEVDPAGDASLGSDSQTSSSVLDSVDRPADTQQGKDDGSNTTAPRGILPQCFATESTCKKTTNDCSGHGSCQSKYQYREGDKTIECFACRCNATVETKGKGKYTTYWSGPACQKRDVSTPFWLFAGITFGLLLVVTWGVGLLYSVGQEELPSVIGAGVAGPRPK